MPKFLTKLACFGLSIFWLQTVQAEPLGRLLLFTTEDCSYCQAFMTDVGNGYSKTIVGQQLPMLQIDKQAPPKIYADLAKELPLVPAFIIQNMSGIEQTRFLGYGSEDLFWDKLESALLLLRTDTPK
ncbi:MAG: thioredoxin family protein [Magnetococcus sp. DMHC-6]